MGHRLSKIATRTGDKGETGLGDGTRVTKDSARIQALGDIDELNSSIGVLLAEKLPAKPKAALLQVQHDLFDLGGEICIPGHAMISEAQVLQLDALLETYNKRLAPLKEFILPGGARAAALAHLSRTVCRRAERSLVALGRAEPVGERARQYLNRLSDLLFVLGARSTAPPSAATCSGATSARRRPEITIRSCPPARAIPPRTRPRATAS